MAHLGPFLDQSSLKLEVDGHLDPMAGQGEPGEAIGTTIKGCHGLPFEKNLTF